MQNFIEELESSKIVAILRGIATEKMPRIADILQRCGIRCVEVTFSHGDNADRLATLRSISILAECMAGKMHVGAGTCLSPQDVIDAKSSGASFIISPNVDADVVETTKNCGLFSIPGAMTPSEVVAANKFGADIVKIFPAGQLGANYIKALKSPLPHIKMMAVGGVSPENAATFIASGCIAVGCASNIVDPALVAAERFDEIAAKIAKYRSALQ